MTFFQFSKHLSELESTSSRLEMTKLLARLYQELADDERIPATYLMLGSLVPPYQSLEFQLSTKMIVRALARIQTVQDAVGAKNESGLQTDLFGSNDSDESLVEQVTARYKQVGDIGELAADLLKNNSSVSAVERSVLEVYNALVVIAHESGSGSQERKIAGLIDLLSGLEPLAAKYVVRIVVGKLRLGFSTMTILDALSYVVVGDKSEHDVLEEAYQKKADAGALARVYLAGMAKFDRDLMASEDVEKRRSLGRSKLLDYSVEVGIPFVPALCQRLNSAGEMIEKMGEVVAEPKYDGLRAQIHFGKNGITAYTRSLENVTAMYPELTTVAQMLKCDSCILDAEAIGYDQKTNELQKFQATITRKRKHEITATAAAVPIRFCVFDVLAHNGTTLTEMPLMERKKILRSLFDDSPTLYMTPYIVTKDPVELRAYHESMLGSGLEGVVVKKSNSSYMGGRKGWRWVKIKEEEGTTGKLSDTIDVIVMGYYLGRGKRSEFGIGALLVGVLSSGSDGEVIKTVAKIGTGLSDEQLKDFKRRCDNIATQTKPTAYDAPESLIPDVWVEPQLVIEVAADEVTESPTHTAGIALRFPRLIKLREDKLWEQATTVGELKKMGL